MTAPPSDALSQSRSLEAKRTWTERGVGTVLLVAGTASVMTTAAIVVVLFKESFGFFRVVPLSRFLGDTQWTPLFADKHFGIWPLVAGTLLTTAIAVAVALPLGLMAAIYLSEFAPARARRALKPALEILAGVPTVVYGYFALSFVTPVLQRVVPGVSGFSALSAGITGRAIRAAATRPTARRANPTGRSAAAKSAAAESAIAAGRSPGFTRRAAAGIAEARAAAAAGSAGKTGAKGEPLSLTDPHVQFPRWMVRGPCVSRPP